MLAAVGLGWDGHGLRPMWGCAVYLTIPGTSVLLLDGRHVNFGFEVLTPEPADPPTALAVRMDERLVACRRRAQILAGHDLGSDLDRLNQFTVEQRLPGVDGVRQQWVDRVAKGRGMAKMIDTAHDLGPANGLPIALPADVRTPADLAAVCARMNLTTAMMASPSGSDLSPSNSDTDSARTVRRALSRTLAVALIAARHAERYNWTSPVEIDGLVSDAAWDLLAALEEELP